MKKDILEFSLEGVGMKRVREYLELKVKGLEEQRPSLLKGDYVLAKYDHYVYTNVIFRLMEMVKMLIEGMYT
jgi:hypothetical protein